ncbi:hypothetical protein B296_00029518, partial [Ensete ventricosum]
EFARRFIEGIGKLAGTTLGNRQKKTIGLVTRIPEAAELGGKISTGKPSYPSCTVWYRRHVSDEESPVGWLSAVRDGQEVEPCANGDLGGSLLRRLFLVSFSSPPNLRVLALLRPRPPLHNPSPQLWPLPQPLAIAVSRRYHHHCYRCPLATPIAPAVAATTSSTSLFPSASHPISRLQPTLPSSSPAAALVAVACFLCYCHSCYLSPPHDRRLQPIHRRCLRAIVDNASSSCAYCLSPPTVAVPPRSLLYPLVAAALFLPLLSAAIFQPPS